MPAPLVSLAKLDRYDRDAVLAAVRALLAPLGGMERFVPRGARVILKPNLLFGRPPDKALNTHPELVRAAAVLAAEAGAARIGVGDSPGFGTARAAAKGCGILDVVEELGLEMAEFTPTNDVSDKRFFAKLELAGELRDADVVINLPKLKTHGQMLMTLAVKNMFGAVPGTRKLQWHYRAGRDRLLFARMLNEICQSVRPALSILDGVVGMDGLGPSAGRARPVGFLAAGADPWAVDATVMDILGVERTRLFTLAAAAEHGPRDWRDVETTGPAPADLRPGEEWRLPELVTLQMHGGFVERRLPGVAKWLRSRISPRPEPNAKCIVCGHCVNICPAKAMRIDAGKVVIDDAACIRCYCCHELCQYDGMDMRSGGVVARLLGL